MNAGLDEVDGRLSVEERALARAREWGWQSPPDAVLEMAKLSVAAESIQSGDLFVRLGILTASEKDRLLALKPGNKRSIDWFAESSSKAASEAQRVLTIKEGLPYYSDISLLSLHESAGQVEVAKRCEKYDAALMCIEQSIPVLVFSSNTSLQSYKALGRQDRLADPILRAVADLDLKYAIAPRDSVSAALLSAKAGNEAHASGNGANIFHSISTGGTEEERLFSRMADHAIEINASDIWLRPNRDGSLLIFFRIYGRLVKPKVIESVIGAEVAKKLIQMLERTSGANTSGTQVRTPTDGHITHKTRTHEAHLRLSFIPTNHPGDDTNKKSVDIRVLPIAEGTVETRDLKLPTEAVEELEFSMLTGQGMVLVVGPTNSGKSSTVAGALGMHVKIYGDSMKRLTLENPIEQYLYGLTQFQADEEDYDGLLKGIKRHDPNVIWVGEVRGKTEAEIMVTCSASGPKVLGTFHSNDTLTGFDGMARLVGEDYRFQYVESLGLILSQRLVPVLCKCCESRAPTPQDQRIFKKYVEMSGNKSDAQLPSRLAVAKGCDDCLDGYAGVIPICEVLPFGNAAKAAAHHILNGTADKSALAGLRTLTLFESGMRHLRSGTIDLTSLIRALPT